MARLSKEQRALNAARRRRDNGDPLPFMLILSQERSRRDIIPPVEKSRRKIINVVRSL